MKGPERTAVYIRSKEMLAHFHFDTTPTTKTSLRLTPYPPAMDGQQEVAPAPLRLSRRRRLRLSQDSYLLSAFGSLGVDDDEAAMGPLPWFGRVLGQVCFLFFKYHTSLGHDIGAVSGERRGKKSRVTPTRVLLACCFSQSFLRDRPVRYRTRGGDGCICSGVDDVCVSGMNGAH